VFSLHQWCAAVGSNQHVHLDGVYSGSYRHAATEPEIDVTNGVISRHVEGISADTYVLGGPSKIAVHGTYLR